MTNWRIVPYYHVLLDSLLKVQELTSFVRVSRQCHFLRREVFCLALVLGFGLMPVDRTSQVNSRPKFCSSLAISFRVVILWR